MATRLTRQEKRAQTRSSLLEAATRVFARKGFNGASLDEIAEAAGFSKGAIYSNFESKEHLFLAVLDKHNSEQQATIRQVLSHGRTLTERLQSLGRWFSEVMEAEREWSLLALEFTMYAARNPELRSALLTRDQESRAAVAALIRDQAQELGIELPVPAELAAAAVLSMGTGMAVQRLVEGDAFPSEVFPAAVSLLIGQAPGELMEHPAGDEPPAG